MSIVSGWLGQLFLSFSLDVTEWRLELQTETKRSYKFSESLNPGRQFTAGAGQGSTICYFLEYSGRTPSKSKQKI